MRRPIHVKRARAEIRIIPANGGAAPSQEVRIVLNDLTPKGIGLYTTRSLPQDLDVTFVLIEPEKLEVRGRISWCQPANMNSAVLSQNSFGYRVGIRFVFENKQDEERVKTFCENLFKNLLYTRAA